jgi:hypothetical protein
MSCPRAKTNTRACLVSLCIFSPCDIPSHVSAMHRRRHPPIRLGSVDNSNANTCAHGIPIMNGFYTKEAVLPAHNQRFLQVIHSLALLPEPWSDGTWDPTYLCTLLAHWDTYTVLYPAGVRGSGGDNRRHPHGCTEPQSLKAILRIIAGRAARP